MLPRVCPGLLSCACCCCFAFLWCFSLPPAFLSHILMKTCGPLQVECPSANRGVEDSQAEAALLHSLPDLGANMPFFLLLSRQKAGQQWVA